jgi:hypothetical protein
MVNTWLFHTSWNWHFMSANNTILRDEIIITQKNDEGMAHIKRRKQEGDCKVACFCEDAEGTLWFKERLVVPRKEALKKKILDEAHTTKYSIHPRKLRLLTMCQSVTPLRMSRSTIWCLEDCCNHWASRIGSGIHYHELHYGFVVYCLMKFGTMSTTSYGFERKE